MSADIAAAIAPRTVLIVDDEAPARARLRDLLGDLAEALPNRVLGEAADGLEALALLAQTPAEVVLVDIRMPRLDGIALARHLARLPHPPAVIFTTAYDSYAVTAFELHAIDYLLKPVRAPRLLAALQRLPTAGPAAALPEALLHELQPEGRSHLACHDRGQWLLIPVDEVLYLRADFKYVAACTAEREYLIEESLLHLEQEFASRFIRLHRGVLVARTALRGFAREPGADGHEGHWVALLRARPERLPVSRRQWPLIKDFARQCALPGGASS